MKIGVLALQGAFAEHIAVLRLLDVDVAEIRLPEQINGIDGLIIPGGESTSITNLMSSFNLVEKLRSLAKNNFPIFGTCAGMIVISKDITDRTIEPIEGMAIKVKRNAFGRQVDSFETDLEIPVLGKKPFHTIFIRAPLIKSVGKNVQVLAKLPDGSIVAARQGKLLVTSFHPELTEDTRFHQYFLDIVSGKK